MKPTYYPIDPTIRYTHYDPSKTIILSDRQ